MESRNGTYSSEQDLNSHDSTFPSLPVVDQLRDVFNPLVAEFVMKVRPEFEDTLSKVSLDGLNIVMTGSPEDQASIFPAFKTGRFLQYLAVSGEGIFDEIVSPIGEYGLLIAQANMFSAVAINRLIDLELEEVGKKTDTSHAELLKENTELRGCIKILQDGENTNASIFGHLTAVRMASWEDDPVGLFRKAVKDGVVNTMARKFISGRIVPMIRLGMYIDHPLQWNGSTFSLSQALLENLRADYKDDIVILPNIMRDGCPASRKTIEWTNKSGEKSLESGVNLLAGLHTDAVEYYYEQLRQAVSL